MAFQIENGVLEKYIEELGVTEVVILEDATIIGEGFFSDCGHLVPITIPFSVSEIDLHPFYFFKHHCFERHLCYRICKRKRNFLS